MTIALDKTEDRLDDDSLDKRDHGVLVPLERWMGRTGLRFVPHAMSANQVTLLSALFGVASGGAFALAAYDRRWFLVGSVFVLCHWIGDNVDGHVARTRNQCTTTGRFLDIFGDAVTFAAMGLGFAACGSAHFAIVAVATVLCMLQYVLTMLWIALTRIWPFPAFGPAEASLTAILLGLAAPFLPTPLVTVLGTPLSLIDLAFGVMIPGCLVTIAVSAVQLHRELESAGAARAADG